MPQPDYEYRGSLADSWDLLRGDTSKWPDGQFYRDIVKNDGEPALDVGCGTGRLILEYMSAGLDVDGIDISKDMLDICRQKAENLGLAPKLYMQLMEELDIRRKYQTIFVPSYSFQLITEPSHAIEALRRFHHHLQPGGLLAVPFMIISGYQQKEWRFLVEKKRPEDGLIIRRSEKASFDTETQLQSTENKFELVKDDEVIRTEIIAQSPATRNYVLPEAIELVKEAGFSAVKAVSGYSDEPATTEDGFFHVFGRRA
jgi:ubiquinone/menaquinone biosynthesis C-methylase UbiE